jgi:ketosteroid isomerase-like protein
MNATASQTAESTLPESAAQAWVEGFAQGWRAPAGSDEFAAHFRTLLDPDVRLIQPRLPTTVGYRAFAEQFARPLFALIPDLHAEVERWAARGDTIYIELTLRGTLGGRPFSLRACDRIILRDGVAVERESYFDPAPLLIAIATNPRAWPRFLRLRAGTLTRKIPTRRRP